MQVHPIPNHATLPDMPSATNTDHDGRYYTETEVDTFISNLIDGTTAFTAIDINGGTLANITIDGNWTAAGQTCADLGIVEACDSIIVDIDTLVVDAVQHRVGIGEASPSQALDLIGSLELENTTSSTTGVIYKGSVRFIHNFQHPSGNTAVPTGRNTFIGVNIGNFTMGETATETKHASFNTAMGYFALRFNTLGNNNSVMGYNALHFNTIGQSNLAMGSHALFENTSGLENLGVGFQASRYNQTGNQNTITGSYAGGFGAGSVNSFNRNSFFGARSAFNITTGSDNAFFGHRSGYNQTTISDLLIIDNQDRGSTAAEITDCLIYGIFAATPAGQSLRINGEILGSYGAKIGDGGSSNYTEINSSGDLTPVGTADIVIEKASGNGIKVDKTAKTFPFRDIIGDQFAKNTGATKPILTTYNGAINSWKFEVTDEAFITYHIPHDYVAGTPIFLHVHWSHIATNVTGGNVTFKLTSISAKAHNQEAFQSSPAVGTYTGTASTVQYQQILSEVLYSDGTPTGLEIDTATLEPDSVIELTFEVDANNITVSGGGVPDIFVHYIDIHYQSTNIGTKDKVPDFYA